MSSGKWTKKLAEAAIKIVREIERGRPVSSKGYQGNVLKDILLYLSSHLSKFDAPRLSGPRRVLVLLPANVPLIPFQMGPLLDAYGLEAVFKRPLTEDLFYRLLGEFSGMKFVFFPHNELSSFAREFDFVVGFGGHGLGQTLAGLGVPFRFFGPRFSIGIVKDDPYPFFLDALSFDGEGCLSPVVLFAEKWELEKACQAFKKAAGERPPQESFNRFSFEYYVKFLSYYARDFCLLSHEALFLVKEFPPLIPARTVLLREAPDPEEVLDFLGERREYIQAVISRSKEKFLLQNTSASLRLPPSRAHYPPLGWFFEKGVNLSNFFNP